MTRPKRKTQEASTNRGNPLGEYQTVSLRSVAELLDTSRSSARRWLREAGIRPVSVGRGRKGAIRYRMGDVREWMESLRHVD